MKELEELNTFEKRVLLACCEANEFSLGSHVSIKKIRKKIDKKQQKYLKKAMRTLISSGFVLEHPTRGEMTYRLSRDGRNACFIIKKEFENGV